MLAGVLSFASPKESSQRKGDPRVGALRVPCATRNAGRLARTRLRLKHGKPTAPGIPPLLSAFHGGPIDVRDEPFCRKNRLPRSTGKNSQKRNVSLWQPSPNTDVSPGPLRGAEQRRGWRIKGEDCLRAKPEFRSPRQSRVAQGTGAAGTDLGSPSFCLLFLGEARKSETPRKGGTPSQEMRPHIRREPLRLNGARRLVKVA